VKPAERFRISAKLYAIRHGSLRVDVREARSTAERSVASCTVEAAWFRRRRGKVTAYVGTLWECVVAEDAPTTVGEFTAIATNGRSGGACRTRWDYVEAWSIPGQPWDVVDGHVKFLTDMLDDYPNPPAGFTGWLRFETEDEIRALREAQRMQETGTR
jgi:hypothetical protein